MEGLSIRIRGIVQGVGFRPYIWHLAQQHQICGTVWNDSQGVMIHAFAEMHCLQHFIEQIPEQLPPLATIDAIDVHTLSVPQPPHTFTIADSSHNASMQTPVSADAATCPHCLEEINDPTNRRYRYPFTNCTHCGPRLSIVQRMPYDRHNTSMAKFNMCPACLREYQNPADRRFHTQTNCCAECGPKIWLQDNHGEHLASDDVIELAARQLCEGRILAIKGLGGFHLACDASNADSVALLRSRKFRYAKPLAVMALDIAMIKRYALVDEKAARALGDKPAAIVLLRKHEKELANAVSFDDRHIGFMLAYTPLHHLLLHACKRPLVMTSGNISEQPQCIDNAQAEEQLKTIADSFLLHDRDIINRLDDSVVRIIHGSQQILRRARGYAPNSLTLPAGFEHADGILAMGAELKNSVCLIKQGKAIVSQHIGDLQDMPTQRDYQNTLALYQQLHEFKAQKIAVDLHPNYISTQNGQQYAAQHTLPLTSVQHHHAHIAASMAEYGLASDTSAVLGVVFDGLGMGPDQQLWGGEFLIADYQQYQRLAALQPIALPGANQAMREPWRNTLAQLHHYFDWSSLSTHSSDLTFFQNMRKKPVTPLLSMLDKSINSPLCSSAGRLFDAFAALLGLYTDSISYEGQAAIALENLATPAFPSQSAYHHAFTWHTIRGVEMIECKALWQAVLNDLENDIDSSEIAARIHRSIIEMIVNTIQQLTRHTQTHTIVLSGGVFQNALLLEGTTEQLSRCGFQVLFPRQFPINDGGIALGQGLICAAQTC